jgi:tetratricopeptide (TPR) repeat protein
MKAKATSLCLFLLTLNGCWPLVLLLLSSAAEAQTSRSAETYLERGNDHYARGEINSAIADFGIAISFQPDLAIAYCNRGIARWAVGDLDGAAADLDFAIQLAPRLADAYNARGCVRRSKRDYVAAIADFTKAIEIRPGYAVAYYNRGNARLAQGDFAGAISEYDHAIAISLGLRLPKSQLLDLYNNRGHAWLERGDFEKAIADFNEAIRFNPRHALAYLNRGLSRLAQGKDGEAAQDLDRCIDLDESLRHSVEEGIKQVKERRRAALNQARSPSSLPK